MSNKIYNTIEFSCSTEQMAEILAAIQDEDDSDTIDFGKIIPSNMRDKNISCRAHDTHVDGTTIHLHTCNKVPTQLVEILSDLFPDVAIRLNWYGDYWTAYSGTVLYEDGHLISSSEYRHWRYDFETPENLGLSTNTWSYIIAPELHGLDRQDMWGIADFLLRLTIERDSSNNKVLLSSLNDIEYIQAVDFVMNSLILYR